MKIALAIAIPVVLGMTILVVILKIVFARVKKILSEGVQARFKPEEIIKSWGVNFFGQKSRGRGQARGNGILVLTANELWFMLAIPKRELSIPLKNIKTITQPKSFLSKTKFRPLVCVEFLTDTGEDSAAWLPKDPAEVQREIEKAKNSISR